MRALALISVISAAAAAPAIAAPSDTVAAFAEQTLHVSSYRRADADLNGDGRPEVFLYVTDRDYCGSGGCTLIILSPQGSGYREVLRSTITRLPVNLLKTSTHGWRDVGVTVAGGGITQTYMARLRFNGRRYPSNPSVPPAVPLDQPLGRVLIGR